jgi:hypothetical protein
MSTPISILSGLPLGSIAAEVTSLNHRTAVYIKLHAEEIAAAAIAAQLSTLRQGLSLRKEQLNETK